MLRLCRLTQNFYRPGLMSELRFSAQSGIQVQHDSVNKEFYLSKGEEKAILKYEVLDPSSVELQHTEVPEAFRGQGVAKQLAEAALNYVIQNNLKMKVTCGYVQTYIEKNNKQEYNSRLIKS